MTTRDAGAVGFGLFGVYLIVSKIPEMAGWLLALSSAPEGGAAGHKLTLFFVLPMIVAIVCGCALVILRGWLADRLFAAQGGAESAPVGDGLMQAALVVLGTYFVVSGGSAVVGHAARWFGRDPRMDVELIAGSVQLLLGVALALGHRPIAAFIGRMRGFGAAH